jgi:hypothetical protein
VFWNVVLGLAVVFAIAWISYVVAKGHADEKAGKWDE